MLSPKHGVEDLEYLLTIGHVEPVGTSRAAGSGDRDHVLAPIGVDVQAMYLSAACRQRAASRLRSRPPLR